MGMSENVADLALEISATGVLPNIGEGLPFSSSRIVTAGVENLLSKRRNQSQKKDSFLLWIFASCFGCVYQFRAVLAAHKVAPKYGFLTRINENKQECS